MFFAKPTVIASLALLSGVSARHKRSGGGGGGGGSSSNVIIDQTCIDFCDDYFALCATNNIFLNPDKALKTKRTGRSRGKSRRNLRNLQDEEFDFGGGEIAEITSEEPDVDRVMNLVDFSTGLGQCRKECMEFPRGPDPGTYGIKANLTNPEIVQNSNLGGDTIWCRKRHLSFVTEFSEGLVDQNSAAFHCPHAGNPSAGICRDSQIDLGTGGEFTPYEHLRDGQFTRRHFAFCDLASNDKVAECTRTGITDDTLGAVLDSLPDTVEVIFLNGNVGITEIPDGTFYDYGFTYKLQAIYLNDCNITEIGSHALKGLHSLKIFNADQNMVTSLPPSLFDDTPGLLQFSMFNNPIAALPEDLFYDTSYDYPKTPDLERIVLYATEINQFEPMTFKGLTKLEMLSFVDQKGSPRFSESSFPDGVFDDLHSLKFFDFFLNDFTTIKADLFGPWSKNILRIAFWLNSITTIEEGAFDNLESLEQAYFHLNPLDDDAKVEFEALYDKEFFNQLTV